MRKADDKNKRISSANFRIEIDEDEEEEIDDGSISSRLIQSRDGPGNSLKSCISQKVDESKRGERNYRDFTKKSVSLINDGNEEKIFLENNRIANEISTLRAASVDELINLPMKRHEESSNGSSNELITEKIISRKVKDDTVLIKLPYISMKNDGVASGAKKSDDELTISKFVFPTTDTTGSRKYLQVPKVAEDRHRVYDVTMPHVDAEVNRSTKKNNQIIVEQSKIFKESVSSPDFLTSDSKVGGVVGVNGVKTGFIEKREICMEIASPMLLMDKNTNLRKCSITNAAIGSSIATSLLGISDGTSRSILPTDLSVVHDTNGRSATPSSVSICSTNLSDDVNTYDSNVRFSTARRKSRLPFLRLHLPQPHSWSNVATAAETDENDKSNHHNHENQQNHHHHHHHHSSLGVHFPHIHVPSFTFTGSGTEGTGRKFNFGIKRHSQMVSPLSVRQKFKRLTNRAFAAGLPTIFISTLIFL